MGMMSEEVKQLLEQGSQIHGRLDHIEKNLILQQPNVVEFTKTVYPYLEAAVKRCEAVEQKLQALENMAGQFQAHMAENWAATDEIVEKQKKDFAGISQLFQGKATKELQGTLQSIRAELSKVLAAEKKCEEALAECRGLTKQVGQTYETASATIQELAETATKHVNEVKDNSAKAIDQARAKFVKTFRRLDATLSDHPLLIFAMLILMMAVVSAGATLLTAKFTNEEIITQSV
jgi:ABC-type transporter Mla subunit MlaD